LRKREKLNLIEKSEREKEIDENCDANNHKSAAAVLIHKFLKKHARNGKKNLRIFIRSYKFLMKSKGIRKQHSLLSMLTHYDKKD
jgi:hypothetical protein